MTLKLKITKAQYDNLSDDMKKEYMVGENASEYVLDVVGLPEPEDTGPLTRALENERENNKTLKQQLAEANLKLKNTPDVDALKTTHEAEKGKLSAFAEKTLKTSVAKDIATKIAKPNSVNQVSKAIAERLVVDLTGDEPVTSFLGVDGKPNKDLTAEKLGQEFLANPDFADMVTTSKATGGGTPPKAPGSQASGDGTSRHGHSDKSSNLMTMDTGSLVEAMRARVEAKAAGQA